MSITSQDEDKGQGTSGDKSSQIKTLINNINHLNLGVPSSHKLLILYAGETGNSEDLAKRIGWQAFHRGWMITANQFDDYQISKLVKEDFVLFICSTTNQGNEPTAMKKFWSFLMRKGLPDDVLSNLKCGVIGLGDSSYLKYNVVGKKLYKRLINLGAKMLLEICLGDDQHDLGLDAAIDPWLPKFWSKIESYLGQSNGEQTILNCPIKLYEVSVVGSSEVEQTEHSKKNADPDLTQIEYNKENYYQSKVLLNSRVTSQDHFQETRFVKLDLPINNKSLKYLPGDIVVILPQNSQEIVDEFISLLSLDRDELVKIKRLNKDFLGFNLFDTIENKPMRIEQLVSRYFDLTSVPKRSFFELLHTYATDQLEKDKLKEFSSTNGQYALYEYCKRQKRNVLEVLADFPKTSSRLKIFDLVQLINPIFPRPYSIASALSEHPHELHILCAVKQQKTTIRKPRLGLCSNYIKRLKVGDQVSIYIKEGTLKIPSDNLPLIMIGPGTGIAPLRSFIQYRLNKDQPSNFLFFGCRSRDKDFYFKEEWAQASARGLLNYYTAFSRDQPNKVYVQDKLWENRDLIWKLMLQNNAHTIVSGSSSQMPKDVRQMLIKILQDSGIQELISDQKAESVINGFEATKKLQFECWD